MKRVVKYWAIRLLGRKFIALNWKDQLSLIWLIVSFSMAIISVETEYGWLLFAVFVSLVLSTIRCYRILEEWDNPCI